MADVYISVGSNIGNRVEHIENAIAALKETGVMRDLIVSKFYETEPVDYLDQDWFVNCAIRVQTDEPPEKLLALLKAIEKKAGRHGKTVRFGPRVIDLDIIFYDDLIYKSDFLEIPHPRMHQRAFVLVPLCDLCDTCVHPVTGQTVKALYDKLPSEGQGLKPLEHPGT